MINDQDTEDTPLTFAGNPKLKKVGQLINMTKDQIVEYSKCLHDPMYFIENYVNIVSIDHGVIPFKLYKYQRKMVRAFHNNTRVIVRAARQSGKTATSAAYLLWFVLFNSTKTLAILANKETIATEILSRVQEMYMNVPLWLQQGVIEWNKRSFELENKSRIISAATSSNAIRGFTISLLFLDEFAHVPNHTAIDFFTSVYPTLSSGKTAKLIICSTPRGMNMFYKLFQDAENARKGSGKSEFIPLTITWDKVPGRNKKWADDQKNTLGEEKFLQEQEVEFLGSAGTLISSAALRNLVFTNAQKEILDNKMKIYEEPIEGHQYIVLADSSHGKELDYSAACVFDVSLSPYKLVAVYRDNSISAQAYPNVLAGIGKYYNIAFILAENNDIGALVLQILTSDLDYPNIFYTEDVKGNQGLTFKGGMTPGLKTTKKTKRQGCNALKTLIESNQMIIQDFEVISELTTFVIRTNGTYAADDDCNDDLVMCLVLAAWLTTQQSFKDLIDQDMRKKLYDQQMADIEEQMPPMALHITANPLDNTIKMGDQIWTVVQKDEDMIDDRWSGYPDKNGYFY
jgi:hypothetical protein